MGVWPFLIILQAFVFKTFGADPTNIIITDKEEKTSLGLSVEEPLRLFSEEMYWSEPNVGLSGGTNRPRYLQIRGVGEASSYENTPSHSVGYWINDIDLTGLIASWPLLDVETVEVSKGPESVLYGGSAMGGAVKTTLRSPQALGKATLSYETGNAMFTGGFLPLSESIGFSFYHFQSDGFYKNTYRDDWGSAQEEYYGRLQLQVLSTALWQISSNHLALFSNNSFDMWSLDNSFSTLSDQPGKDAQNIHGHSLKIERKVSSLESLVSLSSLTFSRSEFSYDADWGNNDYWQAIPGWNQPYDYFDQFLRNRLVWHEKLYYSRGRSSYGVHIYGLREKSNVDHFNDKMINSFNDSRYETVSGALFYDQHLEIDKIHTVEISGRIEKQKTSYSDTELEKVRDDDFLYAWGLGWKGDIFEGWQFHSRVRRGFRGSGVNIDSALPVQDRFYQPEFLINYEIGFDFVNGEQSWGLTAFFMDQKNKQVRVSRQDDPMDPGTFTYFTNNAGEVHAYGFEAQWLGRFNNWTLEFEGGHLKSEFKDYIFENRSLRNRDTANAPEWTYAVGLKRDWTDRFLTSVSFSGKSASYFSNNHQQKSNNFSQVNLSSQYRAQRWIWNLWIKNIFDRKNEIRGFYFANEPPDWNDKLYVQYGLRRRIGGSLVYEF